MSENLDSSLRNELKQILKEFTSNTSFHGLSNINRSKNKFASIFWFLLFMILFILATINYFQQVSIYSLNTAVNIKEFIRESRSEFPTIYFCTQSYFTTRAGIEFFENFKKNLFENATEPYKNISQFQKNVISNRLAKNHLSSSKYNESFRRSLTIDYENMVVSCKFNSMNCRPSDFKFIYSIENDGSCFAFNHDLSELASIQNPGPHFGLKINILLENNYERSLYKGGKLYIINPKLPFLQENLLIFSTGLVTFIGLNKNEFRRESTNNCVNYDDNSLSQSLENRTYYEETIKNSLIYDQKVCLDFCVSLIMTETCGCYYYDSMIKYDFSPCDTLSDLECILNAGSNIENYRNYCLTNCPQSCIELKYETSINLLRMSFESIVKNLREQLNLTEIRFNNQSLNLNYELLENNLASVAIFNSKIGYDLINGQSLMTINNLVSASGGIAALLVGSSFLSTAELFELLILLTWTFVKRKILHW